MRKLLVFLPVVAVIAAFSIMMIGSALSEHRTKLDFDGDGCSDFRELGDDASAGGLRDPFDPWDFYDVAGRGGQEPDGVVDMTDLQAVSFRWNTEVGTLLYDAKYDRTVELVNGPYDLGPPDGEINIFDLQALSAQFGHSCVGEGSLPEPLKLVGVESPDEFKDLIEVDLAAILQMIAGAGEGGSAGFAADQVIGDYQVVCSFQNGGLMVVPMSMPDAAIECWRGIGRRGGR